MKSLKIAFVVPVFPVTTETFIVNQIVSLINLGHKVSIFAYQENPQAIIHQKIQEYDLINKTTYYAKSGGSRYERLIYFWLFVLMRYRNLHQQKFLKNFDFLEKGKDALDLSFYSENNWILDQENWNIIHAHFGEIGCKIAHLKGRGFFSKCKLVTTFHGYDLAPNLLEQFRIYYKILFEEAALLTVNTPYTHSLLKKITNHSNIKTLPVGLDTKTFKKKVKKEERNFTILFVGRLVKLKGPDLVIKIFRNLRNRGHEIELIIIGEGEMQQDLRNIIVANDFHDSVLMTGTLNQEKVREHMQNADVLLCPGIYDKTGRAETQGLVIQEAQAMELPVVVSDAGGMKYGVRDGVTGYVVKENDISSFADKIEMLINNKHSRRRMGKSGRDFVVKNYDSEVLGKSLETYYYDLLSW